MKTDQKNLSIETLRGFAILLVVMGHVIGSAPDGGMKIDFPSYWRYFYLWIDYIQMPLFTAIAGWVYALKPIKAGFFKSFISKKAYRLLIPMVVVGSIYFLIQYIVPGTNNKGQLSEIWRIYIFPYTIYWYLPSLFLMFLAISIMDIKKRMNTIQGWMICLVVAYSLFILSNFILPKNIPNIFSYQGAINQFPYFMIGLGICRFKNEIFTPFLQKIYLVNSLVGVILLQVEWIEPLKNYTIYEISQPLWVTSSLFLLLNQSYKNRFFIWIGSFAYTIYLYHGFGTSGVRIILTKLGISSIPVLFIIITFFSLLAPIMIEKVVSRNKYAALLFAGILKKKQAKV